MVELIIWWAALMALNVADCRITWVAIRRYHAPEGNPVGRFLFRRLTMPGAMAVKLVGTFLIATVWVMAGALYPLMIFTGFYIFLLGWNVARIQVWRRRYEHG